MTTLLLTLIVGCGVLGLFIGITMYFKMMDELKEVIEGHFTKDLEKTRNSCRFTTVEGCDILIDDFERRWKGRVDKEYLNYSIGKLIEAQFQNELNYKHGK